MVLIQDPPHSLEVLYHQTAPLDIIYRIHYVGNLKAGITKNPRSNIIKRQIANGCSYEWAAIQISLSRPTFFEKITYPRPHHEIIIGSLIPSEDPKESVLRFLPWLCSSPGQGLRGSCPQKVQLPYNPAERSSSQRSLSSLDQERSHLC